MMQKKIVWRILLLPFALIYSFIALVRNKLYDWGIVRSSYGVLPTVVIGNLTVGGTGKTPMTIFISRMMADEYNVAILSRGYKRRSRECVIADGDVPVGLIGDEPKLIERKTGLPVAVCADRHKGLEMIKEGLPETDVVILDDAFQHRRLKGNVSILLIDYNRPVFNDFFLPAGNLRDNRYRLSQADVVVFTRCPGDMSLQRAQRLASLTRKNKDDVFFASIAYQDLQNYFTGERISLDSLRDYKLLLISGLADNSQFVNFLKGRSTVIEEYRFADHKEYKFAELQKIFYNFAQLYTKNGLIVTTDKDFVKIKEYEFDDEIISRLFVLPIDVHFLFDSEGKFKFKILEKWKKTYS